MSTKKKMPRGKPFEKGKPSANPGGVTSEEKAEQATCRADARKHKFAALDTLVKGMEATKLFGPRCIEHPDWPARIDAANSILDRGFGRPAQAIADVDGKPFASGIIILPAEDPKK